MLNVNLFNFMYKLPMHFKSITYIYGGEILSFSLIRKGKNNLII